MKKNRIIMWSITALVCALPFLWVAYQNMTDGKPTAAERLTYDLWKEKAIHEASLDSIAAGSDKSPEQIRAEISDIIHQDSIRLGWKIQSRQ